jgi:DNA adenine methylase
VFFLKAPSRVEVLNDLNGDLINLYRVVRHHLDEFVRQFRWALSSRELFDWAVATPPATLTDIQRAARFFYLQKTAFGARVSGYHFGTSAVSPPRLNLLRLEEDLSAAHIRLSRCLIEHLPWDECVRRYDRPGTLFYCDPPYWDTAGYGMEFGMTHYAEMAKLSRSIQGQMVISVNDSPEMRDVFSGLTMDEMAINYSLRNRRSGAITPSTELLIRNC